MRTWAAVMVVKGLTAAPSPVCQNSGWAMSRRWWESRVMVISLKALRGGKKVAAAPDKFLGFGNRTLNP